MGKRSNGTRSVGASEAATTRTLSTTVIGGGKTITAGNKAKDQYIEGLLRESDTLTHFALRLPQDQNWYADASQSAKNKVIEKYKQVSKAASEKNRFYYQAVGQMANAGVLDNYSPKVKKEVVRYKQAYNRLEDGYNNESLSTREQRRIGKECDNIMRDAQKKIRKYLFQ